MRTKNWPRYSGLSVKTRNCDRCQISLLEQQARYCSGCKAQISREKKQGINWGTPGTMSTKLEMILNLLDTFDKTSKGDKSIIFSQFTSFLDLVQDALNDCGRNFVRYDGSMRRNAREEALQKIRSDEGIKIILISFKAGSTGLNLTCCNRVILCDLWWNPQIEEQAFDRAHRLGQSKNVYIYKLSIDGTVEQRILALQDKKRQLAQAALNGKSLPKRRCSSTNDFTEWSKLDPMDLQFLFQGSQVM